MIASGKCRTFVSSDADCYRFPFGHGKGNGADLTKFVNIEWMSSLLLKPRAILVCSAYFRPL